MIALLPVSLVTAGAIALLNFWLMLRVGQVRRAVGISVGDGGHEPLVRRMRAHANLVESAPFVLLLIALVELADGPSLILWIVAAAYVAARLAHAIGMDGWMPGRMIGTIVSMLAMVGLGIAAIVIAARGVPPRAPARGITTYAVPKG